MSEYKTHKLLDEMERMRMTQEEIKLRPLSEIMATLAAPIPDAWIDTKVLDSQGHTALFVPYHRSMERLDEATSGAWSTDVKVWDLLPSVTTTDRNGKEIIHPTKSQVTVSITIHALEGSFTKTGTGIEDLGHAQYGDELSNAFAMAFNRAMMQWGFARILWDKERRKELEDRLKGIGGNGNQTGSGFPKQTGGNPNKLMSDKQHNFLERLAKNIDPDNYLILIKQTLKNVGVSGKPATSAQASEAIKTLQALQDGK